MSSTATSTDRKAQAARTLDRILKAATAEFSEKGFEGARMDVIARAAGVNKQLPYHYFASKDGLFQAVLQLAYRQFRGNHRELASRLHMMDAKQALWGFISALWKSDQEARGFQQLLQDENRFRARHVGTADFQDARQAYQEILGLLRAILERGCVEGCFRPGINVTELYISIGGLFQFRATNCHTLSAMLETDVDSDMGAAASRDAAFQLLLSALRP